MRTPRASAARSLGPALCRFQFGDPVTLHIDPSNPPTGDPEHDYFVGYHAGLFYDVLGQSNRLRDIRCEASSPAEPKALVSAFSETAGTVRFYRGLLRKMYKNLQTIQTDISALPGEAQEEFRAMRKIDVRVHSFSDSTFAHLPLLEAPGPGHPIISVHALIFAGAVMLLQSLANGHPIRAALTVGCATNLEADEIYGPLLDTIYLLESKVAGHPRVVVGDGLLDYLRYAAAIPGDSRPIQIQRRFAGLAQRLLTKDEDDVWIVDYLGPGMHALIGPSMNPKLVLLALETSREAVASNAAAGNEKLRVRYEAVVRYLERNAPRWLDETWHNIALHLTAAGRGLQC